MGHLDAVYSLEFVRDGGLLVSGSGDATVKVWSLETDSHRTLSVAEIEADEAGIASITISADGKHIATGHMDSIVRIWNLATGDLVESLQGHSDSVYGVAFTSDNKGLVSGGLDNTVKYWNIGPVLCRPFNSAPGPAEKRPLSDEDRDKADGSSLLLSKSEVRLSPMFFTTNLTHSARAMCFLWQHPLTVLGSLQERLTLEFSSVIP